MYTAITIEPDPPLLMLIVFTLVHDLIATVSPTEAVDGRSIWLRGHTRGKSSAILPRGGAFSDGMTQSIF